MANSRAPFVSDICQERMENRGEKRLLKDASTNNLPIEKEKKLIYSQIKAVLVEIMYPIYTFVVKPRIHKSVACYKKNTASFIDSKSN